MSTVFESLLRVRSMFNRATIGILRANNMLLTTFVCSRCGLLMVERNRDAVDECCWTCNNTSCSNYNTTKSIGDGSFFTDLELHYNQFFRF